MPAATTDTPAAAGPSTFSFLAFAAAAVVFVAVVALLPVLNGVASYKLAPSAAAASKSPESSPSSSATTSSSTSSSSSAARSRRAAKSAAETEAAGAYTPYEDSAAVPDSAQLAAAASSSSTLYSRTVAPLAARVSSAAHRAAQHAPELRMAPSSSSTAPSTSSAKPVAGEGSYDARKKYNTNIDPEFDLDAFLAQEEKQDAADRAADVRAMLREQALQQAADGADYTTASGTLAAEEAREQVYLKKLAKDRLEGMV